MVCCPSGLSTISVGVACGTKCIAASMVTGLSGGSISLIQIRTPIQIRWASSDLSVLETHPLTPGVILNPATVTVDPISHPKGLYGAALGIALVPLILAILAVGSGWCILAWKRQRRARSTLENQRQQQHEMFKPSILKLPWMVALMGFVVTAIALVELSCHILPPAASSVQISDLAITKVFVTNTIVRRDTANSTLPSLPSLTCGVNGSFSVSTTTARDSGTSVTIPVTYGTTVCRLSNSPVLLPTCTKPPTAPAPSNWLGAQQIHNSNMVQGSVEGAFFLANVFPTLVATLFAIPWKIMHLHATSLEPWHQMARQGGAPFSKSILADYTGMSAFKAPLTALTTCLVYLSAMITALASEAWGLGLVGSCTANTSRGCLASVQVNTQVVHTMQAILGLVGLLAICLAVVLPRWNLGVWADPRNTSGIASLAHGGWVLSAFGLFDLSADKKVIEKRVGQMTVWLGSELMQDGTSRYGMVIAGNVQDTEHESKTRPERLSMGRISAMIGGLAILMLGLDALIIYYILTNYDTGFERFMSGQGFGPRFLFSVCGIIINLAWMSIFKDVLLVAPYYSLELGRSDTYMTSPYATDNYTALGRGIKRRSPLLVLAALPTVLGDFLPLLLANVPFNRATTWNAHWICSWFAVGQLTCMTVASLLLVVVLFAGRPDGHVNFSLLRKAPIAAILVALSISGQGAGNVSVGGHREEEPHGITQIGYGEAAKLDPQFRQQVVGYSGYS
ncbi:hypothetical protein GQ53DRAFT_148909 [Thozetella sp. PMI_491]|nr:hypothetical protein GQ53DRAFT_148909 [Thozetella sp. PMI_491]